MANQHTDAASVNRIFGVKLAEARRRKSLTQTDLAEKLGLSRVTIANLEGGRQNVQLHQVFSIAAALDIPPDRLIPMLKELEPGLISTRFDSIFLELTKSRLRDVTAGES